MKKNKNSLASAFSLVELLVAVGIIGVLSGISVLSFQGYNNKATDSASETNIRAIDFAIVSNALDDTATKYVYDEQSLAGILDDVGFPLSEIQDSCYFITMGTGNDDSANDNRYAIMTWGYSTR